MKWMTWVLVGTAACGGGGDKDTIDASGGPSDASTDATGDAAAAVTSEGFVSAYYRATNTGAPQDLEGYFHAWGLGVADGAATFGAYYPVIGTAMPLALDACTTVSQPAFTNFTSLVAGNTLKLTNGTTMLSMTGPATEGYYYAFDDAAPSSFVGPALSITAGTASEAVGGPGTLSMGVIAGITIASEPVACNRATPCALGATLETSDDAYVSIDGVVVCRVSPTAVTIPTAAFTGRPDGSRTIRVISVRHSTARLGGGSYEVFLANERTVTVSLST